MIIVRKETYLIKRKRLQLVNILVWRQCWETLALFDFALVPVIVIYSGPSKISLSYLSAQDNEHVTLL